MDDAVKKVASRVEYKHKGVNSISDCEAQQNQWQQAASLARSSLS
jgi:hypothetical protein